MHRTLVAACTAIVMSAAVLGAQAKSSESAKTSDHGNASAAASTGAVTFTGCLTPGTNSDSFYLTNAKEKGVKNAPPTVKLVPATKKVDLGTFVTHEVEVSGTVDQPAATAAPASGSGAAPTLTVTKVTSRNDAC